MLLETATRYALETICFSFYDPKAAAFGHVASDLFSADQAQSNLDLWLSLEASFEPTGLGLARG